MADIPIDIFASYVLMTAAVLCLAIPFVLYILVETTERGQLEWEAFKEALGLSRRQLPGIVSDFFKNQAWPLLKHTLDW
jgi:hypothetical protein